MSFLFDPAYHKVGKNGVCAPASVRHATPRARFFYGGSPAFPKSPRSVFRRASFSQVAVPEHVRLPRRVGDPDRGRQPRDGLPAARAAVRQGPQRQHRRAQGRGRRGERDVHGAPGGILPRSSGPAARGSARRGTPRSPLDKRCYKTREHREPGSRREAVIVVVSEPRFGPGRGTGGSRGATRRPCP